MRQRPTSQPQKKVLLSEIEVMERGHRHSRMHRRRLIAAGKFPPPVKLGPNTNAYFLDEIEALEQQMREERDAERAALRAAAASVTPPDPTPKRQRGRPRKSAAATSSPPDTPPVPLHAGRRE
jgi:predicted DNA-binding transcriptional regulator AlpA